MQDERFTKSAETISQRLARLKSASIPELKQQWRTLCGSEPPHRISRELADPCRGISYSGASLRRAKAINPKTAAPPGQRRTIGTPT
jgi:hypothetical protein